jgi:hypothetical protein
LISLLGIIGVLEDVINAKTLLVACEDLTYPERVVQLSSDDALILFKKVIKVHSLLDDISQLVPRPLTHFVIELLEALSNPILSHAFRILPVVVVVPEEIPIVTNSVDHLVINPLTMEFSIKNIEMSHLEVRVRLELIKINIVT